MNTLQIPEGLTVDVGVVTQDIPVLTLKQVANDHGDARFSALKFDLTPTTEDENMAFIRGFVFGQETFTVTASGAVIAQAYHCASSYTVGNATSLYNGLLKLRGAWITDDEAENVVALRHGAFAQALRVYQNASQRLAIEGNRISTQVVENVAGAPATLSLGVGAETGIAIADGAKLGFFGATPVVKPSLGNREADSAYGSNEQAMLNAVYAALKSLGLAS